MMRLLSIKAIIAMIWILAVVVFGLAGKVDSLSSWAVLAVVAVAPVLIMMWWWKDPPQTMSESIQDALR